MSVEYTLPRTYTATSFDSHARTSSLEWVVAKVRLQPQNIELDAPRRKNLLEFLKGQNVPVGSACGGQGLCASCKVTVVNGQKNLNPPNDRELDLIERNSLQKNERISCQCIIMGDIEITTNYW